MKFSFIHCVDSAQHFAAIYSFTSDFIHETDFDLLFQKCATNLPRTPLLRTTLTFSLNEINEYNIDIMEALLD